MGKGDWEKGGGESQEEIYYTAFRENISIFYRKYLYCTLVSGRQKKMQQFSILVMLAIRQACSMSFNVDLASTFINSTSVDLVLFCTVKQLRLQ